MTDGKIQNSKFKIQNSNVKFQNKSFVIWYLSFGLILDFVI